MLYDEEVEHSDVPSPPGSLHLLEGYEYHPTSLHLIDYNPKELTEDDLANPDEVAERIEADSVTWLNVDGLADVEMLGRIAGLFDFHPLVLEDLLRPYQRPKFEEYEDYLFAVTRLFHPEDPTQAEQIGLVLGKHHLITFQETPGDVFDPVRKRIREGRTRIRNSGADYLAYALIDAVVDAYFPVLETLGDDMELLEDEITQNPNDTLLEEVHDKKRELLVLRRMAWSQREMLGQLQREDIRLITDETRVYLRDAYDHSIRIIDIIESYREMSSSLMDLYHSSLSNRMNEIMKVLTIMATIFIPLTFIAGIYGMNFQFMPELEIWWAYPVVWVVMILIALGLLFLFRRKHWL